MRKQYSDGTKVLSFKEAEKLLKNMSFAGVESSKGSSQSLRRSAYKASPHSAAKRGSAKSSRSMTTQIKLSEVLISLIGSGKELYGNLRLQKELFVAFKERFPSKMYVEDPQFVPYRLGPYSFKIASIMEGLIMGGYVSTYGRKGSNKQVYNLTKKGRILFELTQEKYSHLTGILSELRRDMDEFGTRGLLRYIYNNPAYKKYLVKSQYRDRYKDITWGRGKG